MAYSICSKLSGGECMDLFDRVYEDVDDLIFAEEVSLPSDR